MTTQSVIVSPETVLREIESQAGKRFWPIIGSRKGKFLAETVREQRVKTVLEVGTLVGYSAILIAGNLPHDGRIDTIEINPQSAELARNNIERVGYTERIHIHIGNALEVIPAIDREFDMVFIDAAKDEYFDYLKLAEPKLKRGGVVFADNAKMFAGQMHNFLDYVRNSGKYQSQFIDVGFDGVEVSIKKK
jgi:predicted O-methyltransferase YrrM